jgi:hypothetical protein
MQAHGAAQGVGTTIPRRGRRLLEALLAIVAILVIVAVMALMTRGVLSPATGGVGAQDTNLKAGAGSAVVHDDAGNVPSTGTGAAIVHEDLLVWAFPPASSGDGAQDANPNAGAAAGAAVVHDDAGNIPIGADSAIAHDDAGNVNPR